MSSSEVKDYLFEYYELIFPIIKRHRGRIDRIMGDGIIVVFSTVFNDFSLDKNAMFHCFMCARECITTLYETKFEVKVAISDGYLLFCKTGIENFYEELTCIGHPLTRVHRLEDITQKNEISFFSSSLFSSFIKARKIIRENFWHSSLKVSLKGVMLKTVNILEYIPS